MASGCLKGLQGVLFLVERNDGVSRGNLITFYFAVFATISGFVFLNAEQPRVLKEMLDIDESKREYGKKTMVLSIVNEIIIILSVNSWGVLSDKIGRRIVYSAGFLLMAVGTATYPLATSLVSLAACRAVFGLGAAATTAMIPAVLSDYVVGSERGRSSGWLGLFSGLGALVAALVFLKIPTWCSGQGVSEKSCTTIEFVSVGAYLLAVAALLLTGLQGKSQSQYANRKRIEVIYKEGFVAAAREPRLALSYLASFVARGDSVVLTIFMSLWIHVSIDDDDEASSKAGMINGIAQACALIVAPIWGILGDRVDRVHFLVIVGVISAVAYFAFGFLHDPTNGLAVGVACLIGIGEIGVIIGSQTLVAHHAPSGIRGSVSGAFSLSGSIGIIIATISGGFLFDEDYFGSPFVIFGGFSVLLVLGSFWVAHIDKKRGGGPPPVEEGSGRAFEYSPIA